jgi:signal transduction histidine kinase
VPVVATGRMVPGTGWVMMAKMDREEIYAPLRRQMAAVGLVLGSLLVASGLLVALLWRQRSAQMLQLAKDDLARANAELERRVEDRTAQLRETVAELEAFSYSLSHDLRAPLRAIANFSGIVLEDHRDQLGPDAALLEKVLSAVQRMDELIRDVLALSRISRQEMRMETVDLEKLARQVIQERPELQAPRAQVCFEGPLPAVHGHEASLTQCLANLLGNAVKFVAPGVIPQVRLFAGANGDRIRLWVADNGIGIAPEARERVFEIFQRLHSQDQYEGTGIGLAIVKRAVERMGGKVGVESEPGKGSRFWVELQAAAPAEH